MNMKQLPALLLTLVCSLSGAASANAAADKTDSGGLDQVDCRTLLRLSSEERSFTLVYFHGFVSGKHGQLQVDTPTLSAASDRVIDHCIDRPGDRLLMVFEKIRTTAK